jgi:hypothetical protein
VDPALDYQNLGFVADHAYWLSGITERNTGQATGTIDMFSHGFGTGDPTPSATQHGAGTLTGGTFPVLGYTSQFRTWGPTPSIPVADELDINATNVSAVTVNPTRAHVDCNATLHVTTDGPLTVTLTGCPDGTSHWAGAIPPASPPLTVSGALLMLPLSLASRTRASRRSAQQRRRRQL